MIHDERAHDLLAPDDMMKHLITSHNIDDPADIETRVNVEGWLDERGVPSTGDRDLDLQIMAHVEEHHRDELADELIIELGKLVASKPTLGGDASMHWARARYLLEVQGFSDPERVIARMCALLGREVPSS